MPQRITRDIVEKQIARLNQITGSPAEPYTKDGDKWIANPGNFHLEGAYGGHKLARMADLNGCSSDPLNTGFVSLRELHSNIDSYLRALEDVQRGHVRVSVWNPA